jgi:hypothetical protein
MLERIRQHIGDREWIVADVLWLAFVFGLGAGSPSDTTLVVLSGFVVLFLLSMWVDALREHELYYLGSLTVLTALVAVWGLVGEQSLAFAAVLAAGVFGIIVELYNVASETDHLRAGL